jgi:hypothetical protein
MSSQDSEDNKDHSKYLNENFTSLTSKNKQIDEFIQETYLKIKDSHDIVFQWIPCNQFDEIEEISRNGLITTYSAIWKDGPLYRRIIWWGKKYTRDSNKEVTLNCLHNSKYLIEFLINEV